MVKSYALAITHIYPNLKPFVDFRVIDDGNGQEIVDWTATESQPTQEQLDTACFEILKQQKKDELQIDCNSAIDSGFTSSAVGTIHTYPSHDKAQTNFNTEMQRFSSDPSYTSCKFFTEDAGFLVHTKDQFYKAFWDGHNFGNDQWDHLFGLCAKVDSASTEDQVNSITWTTPPNVPTGLTATDGTGEVTLDWIANSDLDLTGYNIFQDSEKIATVSSTDTSYTVSNLNAGTYSFTISAFDVNNNESEQSASSTGTVG